MTTLAITPWDEAFLRRAIELARRAREDGRHPFGALVVNERGRVIAEALNNAVRPAGDPTQHAELIACAAAAELLTEDELATCTLYTSTEPCAMCAGAIYWTGIGRASSLRFPRRSCIDTPAVTIKIRLSMYRAARYSRVDNGPRWSQARSLKKRLARCMRASGYKRCHNCVMIHKSRQAA
jgi:tRNA(Arg) A34 adenosine deaminase TadA